MVATDATTPPPVYFAVGPKPHEVCCPYCKQKGKTITRRFLLSCCMRRQYCSSCGEYLGTYRRPKL
ncbi:uncharacterized protein LOC133331619 [Musca vetustissima]|uniref:uncharacterized protein LOC133331619 n=1 Tax=Musca vetustissima TaxID=27455 RepID=UPI002AB77F65|nr:uncharacterized protein LOC133331619 [Musca vetustissima]